MRSATELAREIQVTDWSTGGEQGKLRPSHHWCSLFHFSRLEKSSFDRPNDTSIQVFYFKISIKTKRRKQIRFDKQNFFS